MRKLSFLLFAAILTVGALTSCGNGADKKPAADTMVKADSMPAMAPAADTTAKDTSAGKPIVPPSTKK